jgi:hypothetical protein
MLSIIAFNQCFSKLNDLDLSTAAPLTEQVNNQLAGYAANCLRDPADQPVDKVGKWRAGEGEKGAGNVNSPWVRTGAESSRVAGSIKFPLAASLGVRNAYVKNKPTSHTCWITIPNRRPEREKSKRAKRSD